MNRPIDEANRVIAKLEATFAVYSKSISEDAIVEWMKQLERFGTDEIIAAFSAHTQGGSITDHGNYSKFAPKPFLIIELINKERNRKKSYEAPEKIKTHCDPAIAKAWVIAMRIFHGWAPKDNNPDLEMTADRAIEIVNREAAKYDNPDAIPDAYKIQQYWQQQPDVF